MSDGSISSNKDYQQGYHNRGLQSDQDTLKTQQEIEKNLAESEHNMMMAMLGIEAPSHTKRSKKSDESKEADKEVIRDEVKKADVSATESKRLYSAARNADPMFGLEQNERTAEGHPEAKKLKKQIEKDRTDQAA